MALGSFISNPYCAGEIIQCAISLMLCAPRIMADPSPIKHD